jgi:hypothetical protein
VWPQTSPHIIFYHECQQFGKAALSAGLAGAAGYFMGLDGDAKVLGMTVRAPVALGISSALGSVAADVSAHHIIPHVPVIQRVTNLSSSAIGAIIAGALSLYFMSGNLEQGMLVIAGVGAGSEYAARYIYGSVYPEDNNVY